VCSSILANYEPGEWKTREGTHSDSEVVTESPDTAWGQGRSALIDGDLINGRLGGRAREPRGRVTN
jgi:hypothetical protein